MSVETTVSAETWNIDPAHTGVSFTVRHMGLFTVRGSFKTVSGTVRTEGGRLVGVEATIDPASIETGNADRDNHLRSGDFLDAQQYPQMTFRSTSVQQQGENRYQVTGDLTMHGVTRPVTLDVETVPPMKDPFGLVRAGGVARTTLSRKEFGLVWNQVIETGSLLVGDEVKIELDVQVIKA